ncbi:hypothetical protein BD769DRAFT_1388401 [Suillus cothurnatus]|nr:hypothetical protein BD769DRAFT_1388401 [Suillus cothurnatus]
MTKITLTLTTVSSPWSNSIVKVTLMLKHKTTKLTLKHKLTNSMFNHNILPDLNPCDQLLPGHVVMPGPPPVSQSVIAIWTATTRAARSNISQNYHPMQQEQIHTTEEERCWLFLTVLQRERELEEMANELDNAWRELNEVQRLLGIRRN